MSSLSSLLTNTAKQNGSKSLMENIRGTNEVGETVTTDHMKIRVMNMQEYKEKKFMEERKNTKAWDGKTNKAGINNANTNKKKKNPNKKEQKSDKNSEENKKGVENKLKLYRPPIQTIMQQKETKKEELFPDLMQVKKTNKTEKEKEKEKSKSQNKNAKKK